MSTEEPFPADSEKPESGFDPGSLRRDMATQAARDASLELDHLRKLLAAQDAAKVHAQSVAANMQKEMRTLESDNSRLRAEIKRLQDQVALAKHDGEVELRQVMNREEALKKELIELRSVANNALDTVSGSGKWLKVSLALCIPALILGAVLYFHPSGASADSGKTGGDSVVAESATPPPASNSKPSGHDLSAGLTRLDQALDNFKGEKPEDVLKRVQLQNAARGISVCSFSWNNGDPTLQFNTAEGIDLNASMQRCADAVEKSAKQ